MYDRSARLYFVACETATVEIIKNIPPFANFKHFFLESDKPLMEYAGIADFILAGPQLQPHEFSVLIKAKKHGASLIAQKQAACVFPASLMSHLDDIWQDAASGDELIFYFKKWQQNFKLFKDFKQTSHYLSTLMNSTPNLIWFKDKNGKHELVNESFCRIVNKTKKQIEGQSHAYIWDVEKDDPACIESERIVMEKGETCKSEETITAGAGTRLLDIYKSPLRDEDGSIMGTVGVALDVTKERQYLKKLVQNNEALETLFTTMDCGILCHSLDGKRVTSVNQAALKLLGYADYDDFAERFQMVAETVMEEDKPKLRDAINLLKNVGDSTSYEYKVCHKDGKILHLIGNAKLVENDGEIICQRFLLDCTVQKLAEEKKQQEKDKRQKELVRALCIDYQLVFVLDDEGAEEHVLQLLDYPDRRLKNIFSQNMPVNDKIALYIDTCVHPEDKEKCREVFSLEALRHKLSQMKIFYYNYRTTKENHIHYFQLKAVRTSFSENSYNIVLGLQSVDSQTKYELEQKSILGEALKQAKKASNAKSIFLSNMSHDIRTPLNAVLGYTSLAINHLDNMEQVSGYLNKILSSGNHLISLINNILDMSHIESGKFQLEEQICNLPSLLQEVWNLVQPAADSKMQNLSFEIGDLACENVFCDKLRLKQILLNLVSNAIRYTNANGNIKLVIRQLNSVLPDHAAYEISIQDNGIGMTEEFLTRIFEPFERAQTAPTAEAQGTGLGMTITKSIVDLMHGDIKIESRPGTGTKVTVSLALRLAAKDAQKADAAKNSKETSEEASGCNGGSECPKKCRILLAEDNEMNQEIGYEFLNGHGYEVDIANNGQEAVNLICANKPGYYGAVLMDVQMPVLNGYEAAELIRALPDKKLSSIPIIAMTANSFEEDKKEAKRRGMDGHIAKPVDFKLLFKTLDNLIK